MVRPSSLVKSMSCLYNFCTRPMLLCKSFASPKKFFIHQSAKRSIVTTVDDSITLAEPKHKRNWKSLGQTMAESLWRQTPQLNLNVAPLAPLALNKYVSGRVFCMDDQIFFQIGGAAGFKPLCDKIYSAAFKPGQPPRHFRPNEVRRLQRDQMVLCSEDLSDMMLFNEVNNEVISKLALPGALYRGRLLLDGATGIPWMRAVAAILNCSESDRWLYDRRAVELVDIGISGMVHFKNVIPMSQALIEVPAMAITIGYSDVIKYEDESLLETATAQWKFLECCEYAENVMFMPECIHPDKEHLPPELGGSEDFGSCVRRVDGLIKFEMPSKVESVPEHVVKLISRDLPFRTKIC